MTLVRPKSETREAWQFQPGLWAEMPKWLSGRITLGHYRGDYILKRRSGNQLLKSGEWLVRSLDSREPEWLTHDQMRKEYEEVVG